MQNNETSVESSTSQLDASLQVEPVGASSSSPAAEGRTSQPAETPEPNEFETVKSRLEEIARAVDDENLSLDDALDLYEEAVKLGLQASNLLEIGIAVEEEPTEGESEVDPVGASSSSPGSPQANDGNVPDNAEPDPVGAQENAGQADPVGASSSSPGSPQANDGNAPSGDGVSTQA